MKRLLTVILVVAIIAGGASGRIPVARASTVAAFPYVYIEPWSGDYSQWACVWLSSVPLTFDSSGTLISPTMNGMNQNDGDIGLSTYFTADGYQYPNLAGYTFMWAGTLDHLSGYAICGLIPGGNVGHYGDISWHLSCIGSYNSNHPTYFSDSGGTVSLVGDGTITGIHFVGGTALSLVSVSIAGPSMVETGQSGTWTATASGGTAPYTYEWYLLPAGSSLLGDDPGLIATGTASTFTHTMTVAGAFQVSLTVLDSTGAAVAATATVNVGATLGTGYRIEFARSGTRGLYLAVSVYDGITGIISPIASTSGTQAGWYDNWGTTTNSFHWVASPSEAVWWQAFSWRWTLRFAYPDGSLGPPPEDFWFQTTITLTNGTHLSVMHHFSTYGENSDTWTDDTGAVAVPETPPAAESSLPAWVQEFLERFKGVIRWAFVPSATDFSSQVAQGWVMITSPVPTIVPQYTIPFPNPNHLLASTGDSVNIDFSMISTWTNYATVKALVQVCLDAVLVFIVIGIVT
jgi:hypothetical protein